MWRSPRSTCLLVWAVILTVLTVRASDTHLHLCFDGKEPPTSVHFADGSVHHDDHHKDQNHADKDVDPFVGALAKTGDTDSGLALLPATPVSSVLMPVIRDTPAIQQDPPDIPPEPFHLRPPLRGPPA